MWDTAARLAVGSHLQLCHHLALVLCHQDLHRRHHSYRDLKLRGSVVREGKLNLLPHEEVFSQRKGVWNLSAEQGNLGSFFVTNVRLVWHAQSAENFNVSIPYMQMAEVRVPSGVSRWAFRWRDRSL